MSGFRKTFDNFSFLAKILLVIFLDGIIGGLYRLGSKETVAKVVGIIQLVAFAASVLAFFSLPGFIAWIARIVCGACWILDIITVVLSKRITFLA